MANLRDLRARKKTVQATKKITAAMKMIAAAKLRRAQKRAQDARPYVQLMSKMLKDLLEANAKNDIPPLLAGHAQEDAHLIIVATSNRGLCGGFNSHIVKEAKRKIASLLRQGKQVKIICVGKRGRDQLRQEYGTYILETYDAHDKPVYADAERLAKRVISLFEHGEIDCCTLYYNKFLSALAYEPRHLSLIPFTPLDEDLKDTSSEKSALSSIYEYEPDQEVVLTKLIPENLCVQLYRAFLENAASEQGARMTAMDGATRNAGDMIHSLDLIINRTRQANITRELVEIIAGAEAI